MVRDTELYDGIVNVSVRDGQYLKVNGLPIPFKISVEDLHRLITDTVCEGNSAGAYIVYRVLAVSMLVYSCSNISYKYKHMGDYICIDNEICDILLDSNTRYTVTLDDTFQNTISRIIKELKDIEKLTRSSINYQAILMEVFSDEVTLTEYTLKVQEMYIDCDSVKVGDFVRLGGYIARIEEMKTNCMSDTNQINDYVVVKLSGYRLQHIFKLKDLVKAKSKVTEEEKRQYTKKYKLMGLI